MTGLTLEELRARNLHREHLIDVLADEVRRGRVVRVGRNGTTMYALTEEARRDLEPRFVGAASFAALDRPPGRR